MGLFGSKKNPEDMKYDAMAMMEKNQPKAAISLFNKILKKEIDFIDIFFNAAVEVVKNLMMMKPNTSKIFIQEKLNAKAAAGIRKITRNIKLPKKPI